MGRAGTGHGLSTILQGLGGSFMASRATRNRRRYRNFFRMSPGRRWRALKRTRRYFQAGWRFSIRDILGLILATAILLGLCTPLLRFLSNPPRLSPAEYAALPAMVRDEMARIDREMAAQSRILITILLCVDIVYPLLFLVSFKTCIYAYREWKRLRSVARHLARAGNPSSCGVGPVSTAGT